MIMPTCKEVSTRIAMGELDGAPWTTRLRLGLHLAICVYCRRFKRQLELIQTAMREAVFAAPDAARTAALERAVLARLGLGG